MTREHASLCVCSSTVPCYAVVRCLTCQRTIHETTLSMVASSRYYHLRKLRQTCSYVSRENHDPSSDVTGDVTHWLLQLCASWTSSVYNFSRPTGPECSRSAHSGPRSTVSHHSCMPYNNSVGYQLKSESHAQHFPSLFCSVSRRPRHCLHQRSSTTSTTVIDNQIRHCLSDKNLVRQTCILSLWFRCL